MTPLPPPRRGLDPQVDNYQINVSVFMPVRYCFDSCSFITYLKIQQNDHCSSVLLFKITLAIQGWILFS